MKTKILPFLLVLIGGLFLSTSAFAQPLEVHATVTNENAVTGSSVTYQIASNAGYKYYWSFETVSGTAPSTTPSIPTAGATIADNTNANKLTVLWDAGTANGSYKIKVYIVDVNGCYSEMIVKSVTVSGILSYSDATANSVTCSDLAGTVVPGTEKDGTQALHSTSSFDVVYNGSENLSSVTLAVKNPSGGFINLDGTPASGNITVNNPGTDKDITVTVTDVWENTTENDVNFTVDIISGTTSLGTVTFDPIKNSRTITIRKKPTISF